MTDGEVKGDMHASTVVPRPKEGSRIAEVFAAVLLVIAAVLFTLHPSITYTAAPLALGESPYNTTTACLSPFNELTGHYYSYTPPASTDQPAYYDYTTATTACSNAIRGRREGAEVLAAGAIVVGAVAYRRRIRTRTEHTSVS